VSVERHKPLLSTLSSQPFEQRCIFKLIQELRKKAISFPEMFSACDISRDEKVTVSEMTKFVEGLTPNFKQKEIHAIMSFLDLNKNGIIEKNEFLKQLTKGEQTMNKEKPFSKENPQSKTN
jgi:Ca2+-binding EF-hand superfamily protein